MRQYVRLGETAYFWFSVNDASGTGTDATSPAFSVREAGAAAGAAPVMTGTPTLLTNTGFPNGCYEVAVAATVVNGFLGNRTYGVFCTLAVDSQNPTGFLGSLLIGNAPINIKEINDITIIGDGDTVAWDVQIGSSGFGVGSASGISTVIAASGGSAFMVGSSAGSSTANATPSAPPPPTNAVVLWFSDLVSGPKTGNTDISLGQVSGQNGCIVSVWGAGLGATQGSSTISCGGVGAAEVYYWGPARPPYSPANLDNDYQHYQLIIFQVSHLAADGAGFITATVGGETSNSLPFIVRSGRIFFVSNSGINSSNPGTWTQPWRTIPWALNNPMHLGDQPGDIIYVLDGVVQLSDDSGYGLRFRDNGTESLPIALIAYPGANVSIGQSGTDGLMFYVTATESAKWWTVSKFTCTGKESAIAGKTGGRFCGNKITAPTGNAATGAGTIQGNQVHFLGNEWTQCGLNAGGSHLYHVLYASSARGAPNLPAERDREIAYNNFHDNGATRAINIFAQHNPGETPPSAYHTRMSEHHVHHNVIVDQESDGILLSGANPPNWIHDNLIIRVPEYAIKLISRSFIVAEVSAPGDYIYNNTFIDVGQADYPSRGGVIISLDAEDLVAGFYNNITITRTGLPYFVVGTGSETPAADANIWTTNIWFNGASVPAWFANNITSDPLIIGGNPVNPRLQIGSPAIGAGTSLISTLPGAGYDFDGNPRSAPYDIGAFTKI